MLTFIRRNAGVLLLCGGAQAAGLVATVAGGPTVGPVVGPVVLLALIGFGVWLVS